MNPYHWPAYLELAGWQLQAFDAYLAKGQRDFFLCATPGAGKTRFALYLMHWLLSEGAVERIVVAVPTEALKYQWRDAARAVGIELMADFRNSQGREAADQHGIIATYQQIASAPAIFRVGCQRPTFAVSDEPHHLAGHRQWGKGYFEAFEMARLRVGMTGTPFRTDGSAIPFVRYDEERKCIADFKYEYADALRDGRCAFVLFPTWDGRMTWWTIDGEQSATFADDLGDEEQSRRLRTALSPLGEWLPAVLKQADAQLSETRRDRDPLGAGLVIAMDTRHADAIADLLRSITAEPVIVANINVPEAANVIKRFASGEGRWLVAIDMVSEGQDIPRLVVGVYATNVTTEMYFQQAVGRFVRPHSGVEDPTSHLFVPADPRLRGYIAEIEHMQDHVLREAEDADDGERERRERQRKWQLGLFSPISATAERGELLTIHDGPYSPAELEEAERVIRVLGVQGWRTDQLAEAFRLRGVQRQPAVAAVMSQGDVSREERKARLSKKLNAVVGKLVNRITEWNLVEPTGSISYGHLQGWLNEAFDYEKRKHFTFEELERALRAVTAILDAIQTDSVQRTKGQWKQVMHECGRTVAAQ